MEYVCPLCCEELDISDRQFFPCKCGYQVCMWCWHRIRESESGLCPACRTPYGDDPHEFSAVDVEEVLKANKEKEAAAKRERDRQRLQSGLQQPADGYSSDGEGAAVLSAGNVKGQMEVPKDRTQLANMRVIRRNLVYAVGLPPSIASEEILKKPEYFGQYGKIAKIVLNRSQTAGGDVRRASASAYVTFAHKEDTLACILALDGFYMEGRNIRVSYGTSKYCSAFIKNVRCNNPECTYLHQMGDVEDTFTKQEIQAGYVTSGRDVLARQQQIVQQALSAASGAAGVAPRRRTGGGGPSGTGRASTNPVFPPPTFDEPAKQPPPLVPPPPPGSITARSTSMNSPSTFPTIAAANSVSAAPNLPAPTTIARAATTGASVGVSKVPSGTVAPPSRKGVGQSVPGTISAASVVAGVHSISSDAPAPLTTLTPLTPLKRANVSKGAGKGGDSSALGTSNSQNSTAKLSNARVGVKKNGTKTNSAPGSPASNSSSKTQPLPLRADEASSIGGAVIAAPVVVAPPVGVVRSFDGPSPLASLGGEPLSDLGGEIFTGPLISSSSKTAIGVGAPIGAHKDKWNSSAIGGDPVVPTGPGSLWGGGSTHNVQGFAPDQNGRQVGGTVIGGTTIGGGFQGSGSSALASILGINLPTGSGSLRESSDLWGKPMVPSHAPISALNGASLPAQGVIGPGVSHQNNGLIGGLTIGGGPIPMTQAPIGGGGNKSDIALLQSLLPGVHITSGSSYNHGGFGTIGGGEWRAAPGANQPIQRQVDPGLQQQGHQWNGGLQASLGGTPIGAIGQSPMKQNQRQAPGSIW